MTALIDALDARSGIVCAVGAGGKKSVLYQLAREQSGRFALTATVHTTEFPDDLPVESVVDNDAELAGRVMATGSSRSTPQAARPVNRWSRRSGGGDPTQSGISSTRTATPTTSEGVGTSPPPSAAPR